MAQFFFLSMKCTFVTINLCKNIPAPLIIDPDVLSELLQSFAVLMSFSHQVVSVYYLVRSFYVIKLVLKIILR